MEKILQVENLTKKFGKLLAVDSVSFSVEKGNVYGLLGPNGSGKSTTLGMLLTTINPTYGSWSWFGNPNTSIDDLKKIGAIIENPNFYSYLSAQKNLQIVCQIKRVNYKKIDEVLELVGLHERRRDKFSTYSLGMKQRLSIASAMLNNPEVLILDEPTNGLDPEGIIEIRNIIKHITQKGTAILLASHLLDEVEKVCSHVIILKKGKSLYCGTVEGMTNELGYFELETSDLQQLKKTLQSFSLFSNFKEIEGRLIAYLEKDISAETLNKMLFEKGIILSHLLKRKERLEDQFLELIKK